LPKKGMGCLVFGLVITSILSLSFLTEGNFYGLFFMFISIFLGGLYFRKGDSLLVGVTKERILLKYPSHNQSISLKKVSDIQLEKGRGKDKADIRIRTKVKKLNTETYKFRIEEKEFLIEGVPDFKKVIDFMNQTHQKYLGQNPPDPNYIEIE
ncbi:MAG: hypothetical protein GY810_04255, partial [Aureispira sp.]|nr:hypothetical protein [Aureispira sp.]